jgi:hypothetical protein
MAMTRTRCWQQIVWMTIGVAVAVLGLLLALWLVADIGLEGPGPMVKDAYNRLVGWALLGCLVAVGATLGAVIGVWLPTVLRGAAAGFGTWQCCVSRPRCSR